MLVKKLLMILFLSSMILCQDKVPNLRLKMLNGKYAKIHDFFKRRSNDN